MDDCEQAEFVRWYESLHPRLVATLHASCGDPDLAAEAADEAIARALAAWDRVGRSPSPEGWIFRTAFNDLKRRGRRQNLERVIVRQTAGRPVAPAEQQTEIWHLVADLPSRQRQAVALRHVAHLTEPEIAQAMDCRRGTISSHLRAAYAALRVELKEKPTPEQGLAAHVYDA